MNIDYNVEPKNKPKKWRKIIIGIAAVVLLVGGIVAWKTGYMLNKISIHGGIFKSLIHAIPGVANTLKGEKEGRINILLLGMRGENIPGGGLLADTIIVASIKPEENKVALISIPRDLQVDNPGWGNKTKINAVYAAGEENGKKEGIADMEKVAGDIAGMPIHYAISINFKGFVDLVDALGGIEITLDSPFSEPLQFNEPHVCDASVFTVPTGEYEVKTKKVTDKITGAVTTKVVKKYPLCTNPDVECGGNFTLPAGKNTLDGAKALCFVRSRVTSNDFERAKRQQIVLQQIKAKAFQIGTLTDFGKINNMLTALGDNVRTDMEPWEMKQFFSIYQKMDNPSIYQRVLENTEEGLLYDQESTGNGYILLPRGDNYDRIKNLFQDVFNLPPQSDIKPK